MDNLKHGLSYSDIQGLEQPQKPKTSVSALIALLLATSIVSILISRPVPVFGLAEVSLPVKYIDVSEMSIEDTIRYIAEREHFSRPDILVALAGKESDFLADAVGSFGEVGVFQIYLDKNPSVTRAQALDVESATLWTMNELRNGNSWKWQTSMAKMGVSLDTKFY